MALSVSFHFLAHPWPPPSAHVIRQRVRLYKSARRKNLDGHEHTVPLLLQRRQLLEMPCRLRRDKKPRAVPSQGRWLADEEGARRRSGERHSAPLSFAFGRTRRDDGQGDSAGTISIVAVSAEQKKACPPLLLSRFLR
ncbi:hypothetical protein MTO96_040807 [Rhipicephalus appendiculatus]